MAGATVAFGLMDGMEREGFYDGVYRGAWSAGGGACSTSDAGAMGGNGTATADGIVTGAVSTTTGGGSGVTGNAWGE